jgi:glucose/arabinose dehydrogenase
MRRALAAGLLAVLAAAVPASAAPRLTPIGTFDDPVHVTAPPQDPHRLFVVEKAGVVKVMVDGAAPKTFLDIADQVDAEGEEGLLSMAFAPDYATSRRFYVFYNTPKTVAEDGSTIRIEEFTRPEATPDSAAGATRRTLLEIPHPGASNHNGGQLQLGPDGMLWIATGDGGGALDPGNDGQNPHSLLGKLLRIDPAPSQAAPYSIPPDNPFADGVAGAREVWAYGLRNPWRFSFDRGTGDLTIGDVGQGAREEIDFVPFGSRSVANFGWRCYEGSIRTPGLNPPCDPPGHVLPVFEYDSSPSGSGCAITGGYLVRDPALPTLLGRYLYADFCLQPWRSIVLSEPTATDNRVEGSLSLGQTASFGEDSCGHVYAASLGGTVARIDDQPFTPCPEEPTGGDPGGGDPGGGAPGGGAPGGGQPPPPPGPAGTTLDLQAPGLGLDRGRRQRLLGKRVMYVGARCTEDCVLTIEANVRLRIGERLRKWRFATSSQPAEGLKRVRLKLRVTAEMRGELAELVAGGARPLVKVVVKARDAAGNQTLTTVYARVIG